MGNRDQKESIWGRKRQEPQETVAPVLKSVEEGREAENRGAHIRHHPFGREQSHVQRVGGRTDILTPQALKR